MDNLLKIYHRSFILFAVLWLILPKFSSLLIIWLCLLTIYGAIKKQLVFKPNIALLAMMALFGAYLLSLFTHGAALSSLRFLENKLSLLVIPMLISFYPAKQKKLIGVVTAPINKKALSLANISFPGHTEIFSEHSESNNVSMMLSNNNIKTVLVTLHCSMAEALKKICVENEFKAIKNAYIGANMFGIKDPIIAVAALNPHAGEMGLFGNEEKVFIEPAIELAKEKGIDARGPFPGDTVFMNAKNGQYDIVVAQYHDQGLIPIKYEGIDKGVNITVGIDFIRTSPDHGTAFDIAGKNLASPESFIYAINTANLIKDSGKYPTL